MLQESLAKGYVGDISHPTILSKSDSQIKNLFVLPGSWLSLTIHWLRRGDISKGYCRGKECAITRCQGVFYQVNVETFEVQNPSAKPSCTMPH